MTYRCTRAETIGDCPHSHDWQGAGADRRAYMRRDHPRHDRAYCDAHRLPGHVCNQPHARATFTPELDELSPIAADTFRLDGAQYPSGAPFDELVDLAATPDPDAPPCEFCGGGLRHFPECPAVTQRR